MVLLLAVSAVSQAQSLKSQIQAMNKPISKVMKKKDVEGFKKLVKGAVTPDFKYSEDGRSMGFDEMVEGMKQGFAIYSTISKVDTKIVTVSQKGTAGTAVEKHMMEGTMMDPKTRKSHKVAFIGTSHETYKKVKGKWLMASMDMKTDKMTMDGKPMPMPPMDGKEK